MSIIQESFALNLKAMRLLHLYPAENATMWFKFRAYLMLLLLLPPTPILGCVYYFLEENFSFSDLHQDGFFIAQFSMFVTKIVPLISNAVQIKKCIHYMESAEFGVRNGKQRAIVERCGRICKKSSEIFFCCIFMGAGSLTVSPVITGERKMMSSIWLPFDPSCDIRIFTMVYSYQFLGLVYVALVCAAIDPLISGLACMAVGQFKVLKDNLTNLKTYAKTTPHDQFLTIHSIIKESVDHHNCLLSFINDYEKCFSLPIFGQCATSILIISLTSLQLSQVHPLSFDFAAMFICFLVMLAQLYIYCYYPTLLYEESISLTDAIFTGPWYEYDNETRKELITLMERSKKPVVVTAGGILEVSLRTFTTVIRRSYSLFAVLKNM